MATHTPKSSQKKMRDYRTRLKAAGLRPVQIWVPDTRTAHFAKEARRQSLLVSRQNQNRRFLILLNQLLICLRAHEAW